MEPLTPREAQVASYLADGTSNAAIGKLLGISENTVKFHMKNILLKLKAKNRTQAASRLPRE
jgi:DNA-binding NarL/FixJ family response regulator